MTRRTSRFLAAALVVGLTLSSGAAVAAPGAKLKQYRVPTADSNPRDITNGSDGNRWFTESSEFSPARIGRITPAGEITEFAPTEADGCNSCILTDIQGGLGDVLYLTSNDPHLMRFDVATLSFLSPVPMPNFNALAGNLAVHGSHVWITDFNNDVVWRYDTTSGTFTSFASLGPSDVAVDAAGNAWFTEPQANPDLSSNIARIDAVTGAITRVAVNVAARSITVATDGKVWFSSRFAGQAVGFLDPADSSVTVFPVANTGPTGIAAAPDGSVWFGQELTGNIANITSAGVVTEGRVVKGSAPFGVTVAPDGDPWYTMPGANKIATLQQP